ncbi:MAG: Tol-Pal system beta propeller repeat protein TolB [Deltaproteobacteria bacterium]|nr:Tol-Pal system beta propeller repeat protein TolB [Deltaproteobacteria bacterium]NCP95385.1 Tol-Pal system beta propeller repeat protein TolB [Deltaproteobacteria bacterium]NCS72929.1 Tol-Pal system beta propeller repeat protein TolB [Deltaproteobacteria bacterium]OIP64443.1 MAG: Tol-Pal system beta propeller repeat protein TolB [Nitrospirae bacterium CG2_30_70_394]
MTPIRLLRRCSLVLGLVFLGLALAPPARAAEYTTISPSGVGRIHLAIPYCRGLDTPLDVTLAQEIARVVADDLEISGYFQRIDPAAYLEDYRTASLTAGAFEYRDWTTVGAEYLVKMGAKVEGERLTVEARLYDLFGRRQIFGKQLTGDLVARRYLLHRVANQILKEVTGEEGVFDTRIICEVRRGRAKEIYVLDFDGHNPRRVVANRRLNLMPDWSPDGKYIAFTSYLKNNPDLFVLDVGRAMVKRISRSLGVNMAPDWSPDGRQLALTMTAGGDTQIFVIKRSGDGRRQLTQTHGISVGPAWSPDGKQICFVSDRSGSPQLYLMNAEGGGERRLSFGGTYFANPAWSPDGKRIAYAKTTNGGFNIFTIRPDGTDIQRVTDASGSHECPSWAPNSQYLVYQTTHHGEAGLEIHNLRTGDHRRITPPGMNATAPDWGPLGAATP